MIVQVTKLEAAIRQLNTAITLVFDDGDSVVIHTLATAAANIFSDVIESIDASKSWRGMVKSDHGLSNAQYRDVMHEAWNFFKHADRNPESVLKFDDRWSEYLIFFAILECSEVHRLTIQMQTFQLWFLAGDAFTLDESDEIQTLARLAFPSMSSCSREKRLHLGKQMLLEQMQEPRD